MSPVCLFFLFTLYGPYLLELNIMMMMMMMTKQVLLGLQNYFVGVTNKFG